MTDFTAGRVNDPYSRDAAVFDILVTRQDAPLIRAHAVNAAIQRGAGHGLQGSALWAFAQAAGDRAVLEMEES